MPTHPDDATTAGIIEETAARIAAAYVFADVGQRIAERLRADFARGAFDGAHDHQALAELVTSSLQSADTDLHLRLVFHESPLAVESGGDGIPDYLARQAAESLHGVRAVERLDGNVALLAFGPVLYPPSIAGDTISAALQLVAPASGLILDLRDLLGGSPETVALVCSYLFDEPTHLITIHEREGASSTQSWTLPWVPGPRFGGTKPVAVIIGPTTFSGGEELAYDLQQHGRATIVGERSRGGAHPRIGIPLTPHLELRLPVARPTHSRSGTNWEGVGVIPDVPATPEDAVAAARTAVTA